MGLWAGIKYALNSTLGTENFKPLNELVKDEILRGKGLIASENIYYPNLINEIIQYDTGTNYDKTYPFELKFNVNGSANLTAVTQGIGSENGKLEIYKNGKNYASMTLSNDIAPIGRTINLAFSMYDVFTFRISGRGVGPAPQLVIQNLNIRADIIDYSGITITNI